MTPITRYLAALPLCILIGCASWTGAGKSTTTPNGGVVTRPPKGDVRGNLVVVDGNGVSRTMNTTVDLSGVQTSHSIVDSMPNVTVGSSALPTGAATESTLGGVLTTTAFNTRTPVLGQTTMAGSRPVTIASNQSAVAVTDSHIPVNGQATMALSVPVTIASNQSAISTSDSTAQSTLSTISGHIPANGQAVMAASIPVTLASNQSALAVTPSLPTGAATETTLGGVLTTTAFNTRTPVLGQATMSASQPVTIASNQSALSTSDSTAQTTLSTISSHVPANGQAAMAASVPVVIASNQSAVAVADSHIPANGQATMALSVPVTIASNQSALSTSDSTAQTTLSTISSHLPANGQATMASSVPVTLASNQSALSTSDSTTQSTLSTISGHIPANGQATMSASVPVAIASNQSAVPVSLASQPLPTGACTDSNLTAVANAASSADYFTQITVTTTAGRIDSGTSHTLVHGFWLNCASGGADVYAGSSSGVTTSNGYKVANGAEHWFEETNTNLVYLIAASATVSCSVHAK